MSTVQESKIVATERLRRDGRWEEASMYRDEVRQQLRGKGRTKKDANEEAWQAMSEKYPPLPKEEQPGSYQYGGMELLDISPDDYDCESDLVRDTLWVYEHLQTSNATAEQAPSLGAWSLLLWAREYRNRFFEQVLPKAMVAKKKVEEYKQDVLDDPGIEELEKMLEDFNQHWRENAVANTDDTIKENVRKSFEDWKRQYQIDLEPDAIKFWYIEMVKLLDKTVDALAVKTDNAS